MKKKIPKAPNILVNIEWDGMWRAVRDYPRGKAGYQAVWGGSLPPTRKHQLCKGAHVGHREHAEEDREGNVRPDANCLGVTS